MFDATHQNAHVSQLMTTRGGGGGGGGGVGTPILDLTEMLVVTFRG